MASITNGSSLRIVWLILALSCFVWLIGCSARCKVITKPLYMSDGSVGRVKLTICNIK